MNVKADATRDHVQERCTDADFDIVGMGSKAEDRQMVAGGCEL
jgi:hypothetical protein